VKKRTGDEETNAETWTQSKTRREMNTWRDFLSHQIDVSPESDANFNFPKIYLKSHRAAQIHRYRAFQQYVAERHQQEHQTNLKDSWNASNHNFNYLPPEITFQRLLFWFQIRELNLQTLTKC
jgi:hypothetical protein